MKREYTYDITLLVTANSRDRGLALIKEFIGELDIGMTADSENAPDFMAKGESIQFTTACLEGGPDLMSCKTVPQPEPETDLEWFVVIGRVLYDDEDTAIAIQAADVDAAIANFKEQMIAMTDDEGWDYNESPIAFATNTICCGACASPPVIRGS